MARRAAARGSERGSRAGRSSHSNTSISGPSSAGAPGARGVGTRWISGNSSSSHDVSPGFQAMVQANRRSSASVSAPPPGAVPRPGSRRRRPGRTPARPRGRPRGPGSRSPRGSFPSRPGRGPGCTRRRNRSGRPSPAARTGRPSRRGPGRSGPACGHPRPPASRDRPPRGIGTRSGPPGASPTPIRGPRGPAGPRPNPGRPAAHVASFPRRPAGAGSSNGSSLRGSGPSMIRPARSLTSAEIPS